MGQTFLWSAEIEYLRCLRNLVLQLERKVTNYRWDAALQLDRPTVRDGSSTRSADNPFNRLDETMHYDDIACLAVDTKFILSMFDPRAMVMLDVLFEGHAVLSDSLDGFIPDTKKCSLFLGGNQLIANIAANESETVTMNACQ